MTQSPTPELRRVYQAYLDSQKRTAAPSADTMEEARTVVSGWQREIGRERSGIIDPESSLARHIAAALTRVRREGAEAMREAAAQLVRGTSYKERYRQWLEIGDGNWSRDSELAKHCEALASVVCALPLPGDEPKETR